MTVFEVMSSSEPRAELIWRELEDRSDPSYFLSWGWIETWLSSLPTKHRPRLGVFVDGRPMAACLFARRLALRHHVLPSRMIHLHATGVPRFDELCVEHNGLLRDPRCPLSVSSLVDNLPGEWDEIELPGIDGAELHGLRRLARRDPRYQIRIDRDVAAPCVDLARVREHADGYLGLLGSSTRAQIRRARRSVGDLVVHAATDVCDALEIYDQLVELHTASWRARGAPGAFADPWFDGFHRRLIARRFPRGEIQLLRIATDDDQTLGCLYNFVYRDRVLFYQSGFAVPPEPHVKPGLLCHAEAIERSTRAGHTEYDFLGGDARYKRNLATDTSRRLAWVRVQRRCMRFAIEDRLRTWNAAELVGNWARSDDDALALAREPPDVGPQARVPTGVSPPTNNRAARFTEPPFFGPTSPR